MPRQLRIQYPGAMYHVISRGNRRQDIFLGEHHYGQLRLETAEAKGERIIAEELGRLCWQETDLVSRHKQHPAKLALAQRLRRETTLSVKQIAIRLHLGTTRSAGVCLLAASGERATCNPLQRWLGI
jgi:hypothetical protein